MSIPLLCDTPTVVSNQTSSRRLQEILNPIHLIQLGTQKLQSLKKYHVFFPTCCCHHQFHIHFPCQMSPISRLQKVMQNETNLGDEQTKTKWYLGFTSHPGFQSPPDLLHFLQGNPKLILSLPRLQAGWWVDPSDIHPTDPSNSLQTKCLWDLAFSPASFFFAKFTSKASLPPRWLSNKNI